MQRFISKISALRGDNTKQLFDRCVRVALENKVSTLQHTLRRKKYRFVHNHNEDTCRVACATGSFRSMVICSKHFFLFIKHVVSLIIPLYVTNISFFRSLEKT